MSVPEVIWTSLTYDQSRTAMDETRRATRNTFEFNEARMSALAPNGGRILYRSLDKADNLRSKTAGGIVMDEAPFSDGTAWHEVIRPMLIDTGGWAWLIGTPQGRNWYWNEWTQALGRPDWAVFHAPTLGAEIVGSELIRKPHQNENPFIPFDELQNLYSSMPERIFRQEILAEFTESGGGVFQNVRALATLKPQVEPVAGHAYVAGLDWALSVDFTVLTVIDATDKTVAHIERFNGIEYGLQRSRVSAVCKRFNVQTLVAEDNAMGGPNNEELRRIGLPCINFHTSNTSKAQIIEDLASAFDHMQIKLINDADLVSELESFESERLSSGSVRYEAPKGMHDDMVMSLALSWYAAAGRGIGGSGIHI